MVGYMISAVLLLVVIVLAVKLLLQRKRLRDLAESMEDYLNRGGEPAPFSLREDTVAPVENAMVKTTFSFEEHDEEVVWHVRQENIHAAMETEVHCLKKDMLLINYEAPDGSRHHNRLWNGGNGWGTVKLYDREDGQLILTDEIEASHIGCEYGEYDHGESY